MMKKKSSGYYVWFCLKMILPFGIFFCVFATLRAGSSQLNQHYPIPTFSAPFNGVPKIAFLFLVRRNLPLDFLWQHFFDNAGEEKFSIYIHTKPGLVFDNTVTKCSYCYGRQVNYSVQVAWGEASMIEAERILLAAALQDQANQRFVLLSDSCVPLYNFSYIYDYLMASPRSFVDSFLDTKEARYNPMMSPIIPKVKWRKGSQWITLIRDHAQVVVADNSIFPAFQRYCKRRPALDLNLKNSRKPVVQKEHNCIPDEHYIQTLLSIKNLEFQVERRTLTYTSWNHSVKQSPKQVWHPVTFDYADATPKFLNEIKTINHVYYDTEFRTEWCPKKCFLFARKFSPGAAMRVLSEGVVGEFDVSSILES